MGASGAQGAALRECLAAELARVGRPYACAELAVALARLVSEASAIRDQVELPDEDLFPAGLDAHELVVSETTGT